MFKVLASSYPKVVQYGTAKAKSTLFGKLSKIKLPTKWSSVSVSEKDLKYGFYIRDDSTIAVEREVEQQGQQQIDPFLPTALGALVGGGTDAGMVAGGVAGYAATKGPFWGGAAGAYAGSKTEHGAFAGMVAGAVAGHLLSEKEKGETNEVSYDFDYHSRYSFFFITKDSRILMVATDEDKVIRMFFKSFPSIPRVTWEVYNKLFETIKAQMPS